MKVTALGAKLSSRKEQLQEVESANAGLRLANEELNLCVASLSVQVLEAQKEATDAKEIATEAQWEGAATNEAATSIVNEAQRISIQADFKVLHQLLFQHDSDFNIQALEAFVTTEVVDGALVKVKAEVEVDQGDVAGEGATTQGANAERVS